MRVLKFGGTSVGNAERMRGAAGIVADQAGSTPLLVVASAMASVTDSLLRGSEEAADAEDSDRGCPTATGPSTSRRVSRGC